MCATPIDFFCSPWIDLLDFRLEVILRYALGKGKSSRSTWLPLFAVGLVGFIDSAGLQVSSQTWIASLDFGVDFIVE
jgi:hypothetical protein